MALEQPHSSTNISLLRRLKEDVSREAAWRAFVNQYGRRIYGWCLSRNLQTADAEDITQNILLKLAKCLGNFEYDASQSFRGWLRCVTENATTDFLRQRKEISGGETVAGLLNEKQAKEELSARLIEAFDAEILEEAINRVRNRVAKNRFDAWHLMAREGFRGAEVAEQLQMKVVSVYTARSQVQQMIRDEVERLNDEGVT